MTLTLRISEEEEKELALIQERLQTSTSSGTISQMIKLWIAVNQLVVSEERRNEKLADENYSLKLKLHKISAAFAIINEYSE